jgi:hypothetical protein
MSWNKIKDYFELCAGNVWVAGTRRGGTYSTTLEAVRRCPACNKTITYEAVACSKRCKKLLIKRERELNQPSATSIVPTADSTSE